jgi:hypothetical protein
MVIGALSARMTAPGHTDAPAPSVTSPQTNAAGWMNAVGWMLTARVQARGSTLRAVGDA